MGDLVFAENDVFDGPASAVFTAIERGLVPGWRLEAGARMEVGAPLRMPITLPTSLGGREIEVLGRISALTQGHRLVVDYHLPWHGRMSLNVRAQGVERCMVQMIVTLGADAISWLDRAAGGAVSDTLELPAPIKSHPIGLLMSKSGTCGVFAAASENVARLAIEEINADGGLGGKQVHLVVGDDASDPRTGAIELSRLARMGCQAVVTNVTSATFARLQPVALKLGVFLIYSPLNEGGPDHAMVLRLGERPVHQLKHSVPLLMNMTGGRRWFLAGNNYCWPRSTNEVARSVIGRFDGQVVGERYERLGSRDFTSLLESIERADPEMVISTFVGGDEVAFEQQFHAAGLRTRCQTLALALDESTRDHIGPEASEGLWSSFGYFEKLQTEANLSFLQRYRSKYGMSAPPVSSFSQSTYDAIWMFAKALQMGSGDMGEGVSRMRSGFTFDGPRGLQRVSSLGVEQRMHLARASRSGLVVVEQAIDQ